MRPRGEEADQQSAGVLSKAGAPGGQRVGCNPAEVRADSAADYECGEYRVCLKKGRLVALA